MNGAYVEPFYGGAARSMALNWHNFIFGAADPWATITVDKLPGALWIQSLSLHIFGFHIWALVLPQVIEGILTILVLYRAVRRVAGAGAGVVASVVMAGSPIVILLNRGNIADSLLILLLVLAADATIRAYQSGRLRSLIWAGVLVGFAFQAKMLQAWLVVPAFAIAYLVAAPIASFLRRCWHVVVSGVVTVVVSLSWMSAISLVPQSQRPYVDGSCDDSVFSQVFNYNGVARLGHSVLAATGCNKPPQYLVNLATLAEHTGITTAGIRPAWDRLLMGPFGHDDAWLLLPTLVASVALLVMQRRAPRTDGLRAAVLLWLTWFVITWVFFSAGQDINSYYVAALIPAVAALCAMGAASAWHHRALPLTRVVVLLTVLATGVATALLIPSYVGIRDLILATTIVLELVAVVTLLLSVDRRRSLTWVNEVSVAVAVLAMLAGSLWASAVVVSERLSPFDSPYAPAVINGYTQEVAAQFPSFQRSLTNYLKSVGPNQAADVLETSRSTGDDILASGREFVPVGGYTGQVPSPSLRSFVHDVADGRIFRATVATDPETHSPDLRWVVSHCQPGNRYQVTIDRTVFTTYSCSPSDA